MLTGLILFGLISTGCIFRVVFLHGF